jgi:hypothetical protein
MSGVAPILPSRDLEATSAFYERLGFSRSGFWPAQYLIVTRWDIGLHFLRAARVRRLDPDGNLLRIGSQVGGAG